MAIIERLREWSLLPAWRTVFLEMLAAGAHLKAAVLQWKTTKLPLTMLHHLLMPHVSLGVAS